MNNKQLQQYLINGQIRMAKFVDNVEKTGPTLFALSNVLSGEFNNLRSILGVIVGAVIILVHKVSGIAG